MANPMSELILGVRMLSDEVSEEFKRLSASQLNWKPSSTNWSIAQCLEHLIITNNLYFINIQKVADGAHQNNFYSKFPLAPRVIAWGMKKVFSPDFRPKVKTFEMFKPPQSEVSEDILEHFEENQNRFVSLIEATKDLDTKQIKVAEPIGAAVNLRLIDAFEVLLFHEKRHFNQAKRVIETEGFPIAKESRNERGN